MNILDSFRFLFADKDDMFFSRHLIMMDFQQYCYTVLRKQGYKHVVFMDPCTLSETNVYCVTEETGRLFKNSSFRMTSGLFRYKEMIPHTWVKEGKPYTWTMKNRDVRDVIANLLADDRDKIQQFAFVIDVGTLSSVFPDNSTAAGIEKICSAIRLSDGSLIMVTAPLDYRGSLPFAIDYLLREKKNADASALRGADTPEIVSFLRNNHIRTSVWEPFEAKQVERMVRRICLDRLIFADEKRRTGLKTRIMDLAEGSGRIYNQRNNRRYNRRSVYEEVRRTSWHGV